MEEIPDSIRLLVLRSIRERIIRSSKIISAVMIQSLLHQYQWILNGTGRESALTMIAILSEILAGQIIGGAIQIVVNTVLGYSLNSRFSKKTLCSGLGMNNHFRLIPCLSNRIGPCSPYGLQGSCCEGGTTRGPSRNAPRHTVGRPVKITGAYFYINGFSLSPCIFCTFCILAPRQRRADCAESAESATA